MLVTLAIMFVCVSSVRVAVLDSGPVAAAHKQYDWVKDGVLTDVQGHGTATVNILVSNNTKCHGVAPGGTIVHAHRVVSGTGKIMPAWVSSAIEQAIVDEVDIISMSFGTCAFDDEGINESLYRAHLLGILLIAAAGNDGPSRGTINAPAHLPYVIAVGGTDTARPDPTSSNGPVWWKGVWYDAPNVYHPSIGVLVDVGGRCVARSGTSVAVPYEVSRQIRLMDTGKAWHNFQKPPFIPPATKGSKVILFDMYHNQATGAPKDHSMPQPYDWTHDHPYTNFNGLRHFLAKNDYRMLAWNRPLTDIDDASAIHAIMLVDPERAFSPEEIRWFNDNRKQFKTIVFADWYDIELHKTWIASTGTTSETHGSNVPSINALLRATGVMFSLTTWHGTVQYGHSGAWTFAEGVVMWRCPSASYLIRQKMYPYVTTPSRKYDVVAGCVSNGGQLLAYGDSSCLDDTLKGVKCWTLVLDFLEDTYKKNIELRGDSYASDADRYTRLLYEESISVRD